LGTCSPNDVTSPCTDKVQHPNKHPPCPSHSHSLTDPHTPSMCTSFEKTTNPSPPVLSTVGQKRDSRLGQTFRSSLIAFITPSLSLLVLERFASCMMDTWSSICTTSHTMLTSTTLRYQMIGLGSASWIDFHTISTNAVPTSMLLRTPPLYPIPTATLPFRLPLPQQAIICVHSSTQCPFPS